VAAHTERSSYGVLDHAYISRLEATTSELDEPFLMLNLMRYHERATYPAGHPDAGSDLTGREADDRYAPLEILHDLGAEVVLFGEVTSQIGGEHPWDRVAAVGYPSVRSFLEMQDRPDFLARHVHKEAGMRATIIAVCRPIAGTVAGSTRLQVELVGRGATPEPGPGQLVLEVDGTPVGDGRTWTTVVVSALTDGAASLPPCPAPSAGALVVDALIQELP
jgi:hypothetical protein